MRKTLVGILGALALVLAGAASALAVSDSAGCVVNSRGSSPPGGFDTHRSVVAQDFAHNARPAGANVDRHLAQFRGDLDSCFAQT